jgi:hypothetical protein
LATINRFFAMMLPFMDGKDPMLFARVAAISTCLFNTIYAALCFYSVQEFFIKRFGSEQDGNFLFLNEQLSRLHAEVETTPAEKVADLFADAEDNDETASASTGASAVSMATVDDAVVQPAAAAAAAASSDDDEDQTNITFDDLKSNADDFRIKFFQRILVPSVSSDMGNSLQRNLLASS